MISYLSGKILNKGDNFIIVKVNNVGYKVVVHKEVYSDLSIDQEVGLYVCQYVRENALDLYGFESFEKLNLFELLISISGIGPKSALNAVYVASVDEFKDSIIRGDPSLLIKVSGVGKKTAERAVLDLSAKLGESTLMSDSFGGELEKPGQNGDEVEALAGLGYSRRLAWEALRKISKDITDSGERIREALRILGE